MSQMYCLLPIQRADKENTNNILHDELAKIANRCGCIIIDGDNTGIIRELEVMNSLGANLKDGLHPNEKGQNLLARLIISTLCSTYIPLTSKGFNVV